MSIDQAKYGCTCSKQEQKMDCCPVTDLFFCRNCGGLIIDDED